MHEFELVKNYQEYAFIDEDHPPEGGANAEPGAIAYWEHDMERIINRSYEGPCKWYLVVFKPFNKSYAKWGDWYTYKGLDSCRKYFKRPRAYILTREIKAEKVHINALVCTERPPVHQAVYNNKYKLHVSELSQLGDRHRVLTYITKESRVRPFNLYLDYIYGPKTPR